MKKFLSKISLNKKRGNLMKTALTKEIVQSLIFATRANEPGIYGALEVTNVLYDTEFE